MNKFLNTPFGSYIKVFLTGALMLLSINLVQGYDIFSADLKFLKELGAAGLISVVPVLINALNPNDPRYGKGSKPGKFPVKHDKLKE